jgi:hypothetical protein
MNSKSKGNRFELEIKSFLNRIYDTSEFARVPNSGAIMGGKNWNKNKGIAKGADQFFGSDIVIPEWYPYSIECKFYSDLDFHNIVRGNSKLLNTWLNKTVKDAVNFKKIPMLFFKINYCGTFACIPSYFIDNEDSLIIGSFITYKSVFIIFSLETFENNKNVFLNLSENFKDVLINKFASMDVDTVFTMEKSNGKKSNKEKC